MSGRRTFLKVGLIGGALLAGGGLFALLAGRDAQRDRRDVLGAVMPVLLEGALPADPVQRASALAAGARAVDDAIGGLSPAAQEELGQLFALLAMAPTRVLLTGVTSAWPQASAQEVHGFLERWRFHSSDLLKSGYQALHDIVLGPWYAQESQWQAIGYAGPLKL